MKRTSEQVEHEMTEDEEKYQFLLEFGKGHRFIIEGNDLR